MFTNCLALLLVLNIEVDSGRRSDAVVTSDPCLMSAAWCLVLRVLDVVADFSLKRKWTDDLIEKWQKSFQVLVSLDHGLPHHVTEYHPGINL